VQFGNGELDDQGAVSEAKFVQGLTSDIAKVKTAIEGLTFAKGFTNMAQAFSLSEKMFLLNGRQHAQSGVMTLTDGKPSFLFQTYESVMQLKDKHVQLYFVPITQFKGPELALMKKWASKPWLTNMVRIPGLLPMRADQQLFATKILVKFCPEAMSPSASYTMEQNMGFALIRENGHCGTRGQLLSSDVRGASDCADLAKKAEVKAFSLGIHYARGRCYAEGLVPSLGDKTAFSENRVDPPCPGGEWKYDDLFDFYILEPERVIA